MSQLNWVMMELLIQALWFKKYTIIYKFIKLIINSSNSECRDNYHREGEHDHDCVMSLYRYIRKSIILPFNTLQTFPQYKKIWKISINLSLCGTSNSDRITYFNRL